MGEEVSLEWENSFKFKCKIAAHCIVNLTRTGSRAHCMLRVRVVTVYLEQGDSRSRASVEGLKTCIEDTAYTCRKYI